MQGHSKGSASRSSHIWFGGGRHTRHPHATSFAQTLADHCSDPAESSALHDKKLLTPRCRASQLLRPLINLATPATKSAGSSLRYAALPRAIFTLAVLLLCALPVRALFDPGEPINSTSAGNFKVSASKGATPVNALAPMRHQVGVPPGCRRTTSLFNDICPAPSIDTSPATAALRSELILCPLPNVEPLAPAKDGKEPQEGPNSRETVWAVSGTITLPAGDDPEGLAGGQSGLDQGPKPSLARIAAPDAEGVSRDEAHAEEFMPEEGAEGYWRHVGGSAVWVPASQSTARRDPTATPQAPRSDVWPTDTMSRSASSSLDATAGSEQQAYSDWSKSVGGEGSDTWLSFAAWRKAHEEAAAKEREDARKAAKTAKSRTTSALPAQDPPGTQRTTTNASHASTLATSATSAIPSAGTVSRNPRADSQAQKAEVHDEYRAQPMNRTTEHAPFDGSPAAMPTFSGILPRPSSPDGGALPAVGNPAAQLATLKHRWNFASLDCAAVVHRSNPSAKFASSILSDKKDRYMLSPCPGVKRQDQPAASAKGESQFVIVELCDEISIDTIVMANFEFFSRMFKRFRVRVARKLYDRDEDWVDIGSFRARNVRGLQVFNTVQPRSEARFFRYLRIDFLEHYGSEFYCPVSLLRVYGLTQMDDYIREEEEMRREKEREDAGIFADADVEQEEQETSQIASSEDEASQLPSWRGGANFEPEVVAKHPAFTPSTRETTIAGRPDTSAAAGGTSESKSSQPGTTSPMHLSNSLVAPQSTPRKESSDPLETLNLSPHFHEDASSPNMTIASGNGEHNLTASGNVSSESSAEAEAIASLPSHTRIGDRDVTEVAQKAASTEQSRLFSSTAMAASETASDKHAVPVEASQQRSQAETVSIASGLSNVSSLPATSTEAEICSTSSDDASATSTPPNAAAALPRSPAQLQSEVGDAVSSSHSAPHGTESASHRLAASSASRSEVVAGGEPALAGPTGESPPPVSSQGTSSMSTAAASPSVSAETSGPMNVGAGASNGRSGPPPNGNHGGGGSGGGSESIYRTITKRLNALEANATLSLQYIEHSTQMLRDVFARMERRQEERMGEMLRALNASNWRQIEGLKRRQQVDLQQAIFEFDVHRQQVDAERGRLVAEMHVLANEVLQEKRFGIVQLMLLLCLFVIMAFTRGSSAAAPLIHSGLARLGGNTPIALQKRLGLHSPLTLTPRRSASRQAQISPANVSDPKQERPDRQSTNDVSDTFKARSHRDRPLLHAVQSLAHGTKGTGRHLVNRRLPGRTVVSAGLKADGGRPKSEDQRRSIPPSAVPVRKTTNDIYQRGARKRPDLGVEIPSSAGFAEMSREELRAWLEYLSPGSSPAREMRTRVSNEAFETLSQALASKTAPFDAPATAPATDRAFHHSAQPSTSFLHADRPEAETRVSNDETFSSDWGTERSEDESTAESLSDAPNDKAVSQQHSSADGSAMVAPKRKPSKVFERSDTLTLDNARFVPDNVLPPSAALPGRSTPTEQVANLSLEGSASSPFKSALGSHRAPLSRASVPLSTWPKSLGSPYLPAESDADDEEVGAESLHWTEVRRSRSISNRKSNARPNSAHSQRGGHITSSSPPSSQSVSASGVTTPNGTCGRINHALGGSSFMSASVSSRTPQRVASPFSTARHQSAHENHDAAALATPPLSPSPAR